ncbi:hypothetical protein QR680_015094 [Steinernema hermaphroditum]|uniref:CUB domain-containing protein n=1 Tax=Steinernema hermaphroditum TaxID=289476 RepID=A0AA39M502_9BILA|nr:hypothetical protein QR680_015094 [Steinernema hermaphroditum]
MIVHHSILVNSLINSHGPDHFQKIVLEADPNEYSGFLMTVSNRLDVHRESCSTWESMLTLYTNQQNISLACTNYLAHYFSSPLEISLLPSILGDLSDYITIVVTSIRLGCTNYHPHFRQCANTPRFCISRQLFCDGYDNCGLNSDETDCSNRLDQIAVTIIDGRGDWSLVVVAAFFAILILLLLFILYNYRMAKARRKFLRTRKRHSSYYGSSIRRFEADVKESEETVALLALGLRKMFPLMPAETANSRQPQIIPTTTDSGFWLSYECWTRLCGCLYELRHSSHYGSSIRRFESDVKESEETVALLAPAETEDEH